MSGELNKYSSGDFTCEWNTKVAPHESSGITKDKYTFLCILSVPELAKIQKHFVEVHSRKALYVFGQAVANALENKAIVTEIRKEFDALRSASADVSTLDAVKLSLAKDCHESPETTKEEVVEYLTKNGLNSEEIKYVLPKNMQEKKSAFADTSILFKKK